MEKNNWNIDQMLHWLDIKIEREKRDIAKLEKQMDGDFLYYFEWNAKSLYKSHFMSDCYKKLRQAVDGIKDIDKIRNVLKENAACCEKKLLDGQLDCRSSSRGGEHGPFHETGMYAAADKGLPGICEYSFSNTS